MLDKKLRISVLFILFSFFSTSAFSGDYEDLLNEQLPERTRVSALMELLKFDQGKALKALEEMAKANGEDAFEHAVFSRAYHIILVGEDIDLKTQFLKSLFGNVEISPELAYYVFKSSEFKFSNIPTTNRLDFKIILLKTHGPRKLGVDYDMFDYSPVFGQLEPEINIPIAERAVQEKVVELLTILTDLIGEELKTHEGSDLYPAANWLLKAIAKFEREGHRSLVDEAKTSLFEVTLSEKLPAIVSKVGLGNSPDLCANLKRLLKQ